MRTSLTVSRLHSTGVPSFKIECVMMKGTVELETSYSEMLDIYNNFKDVQTITPYVVDLKKFTFRNSWKTDLEYCRANRRDIVTRQYLFQEVTDDMFRHIVPVVGEANSSE